MNSPVAAQIRRELLDDGGELGRIGDVDAFAWRILAARRDAHRRDAGRSAFGVEDRDHGLVIERDRRPRPSALHQVVQMQVDGGGHQEQVVGGRAVADVDDRARVVEYHRGVSDDGVSTSGNHRHAVDQGVRH